jgi:hypothetical protein
MPRTRAGRNRNRRAAASAGSSKGGEGRTALASRTDPSESTLTCTSTTPPLGAPGGYGGVDVASSDGISSDGGSAFCGGSPSVGPCMAGGR